MTPMPDLPLSRLLPRPPPLPRRVVVEEHPHPEGCTCRCFCRGYLEGQRAERERADREMIGLSHVVPMLAALAVALVALVAWLAWAGGKL